MLQIFNMKKIIEFDRRARIFCIAVILLLTISALSSFSYLSPSEFSIYRWLFQTISIASGVIVLAIVCAYDNNIEALPVLCFFASIPFYFFYRFFKTSKIWFLIAAITILFVEGLMSTIGLWI